MAVTDSGTSHAQPRVIIVGGGITGLATAYYLQEEARSTGRHLRFTLLESAPRLGGKIVTEHAGDFVIEGGPDCFIRQKPWAAELCRSLGLGNELLGTNDDRRKVFVMNRGRLTPLPDGVMLIIPTRIMPFVTSPLISWPGKLRMGMDLFIPARRDGQDESVADFVRRRLGQEALDKIAQPLMSGIHVSDPEEQSLLGTFPRFRDMEVKHGSLVRGMLAGKRARSHGHQGGNGTGPNSLFVTLRRGLGQMVDGLERALTDVEVVTGAQVTSVERMSDLNYRVITADGQSFLGQAVVLAAPAYVSGQLLEGLAPDIAALLNSIRYVSTATISLAYRSADVGGPLNGFGFVVPVKEQREVTACTYTSTKFDGRAPGQDVLLRCFVGGPGHEELVDLDDEAMLGLVRRELKRMIGLDAEPKLARIFRWRQSNPQYDVGHLDRVRRLRELCRVQPGLFVTGGAYEGVGIPDCVRQGKQAAMQAIEYLDQ